MTESPAETEAVGERLGRELEDGDVVRIVGELGTGKTCFVRGVLRGLGVADGGQSPSFVVERRYAGRLAAHHLDLYRIEGPRSLAEIGLPDRFAEGGVFLIEWGERADALLPADRIDVRIEELGGGARCVRVSRRAVARGARDE